MGRIGWRLLASAAALAVGVVAPPAASAAASWRTGAITFEPIGDATLTAQGVGTFRGELAVTDGGGQLAVVNRVGFEDYLQGISEVPPQWPTAALQAQAIAARTYALWDVLSHSGSGPGSPQICATDACQVYRGVAREEEPGDASWSAAVKATAGQVLLYQNRVIEALYGSSDGGQTTYGGVPWLPSIADPDDSRSPMSHWSWSAPLSAVAQALDVPSGWSLTDLESRGQGVVLTMVGPDGSTSTDTVSLSTFHQLLNANMSPPAGMPLPLPSLRFAVAASGSTVTVAGAGFGHGMGMSQYGALGKAERGMDASSILAAYYGGLRPTRLSPGQEPSTIRVGVASGLSSVTVGSAGTFKVLDGSGRPLAVLGGGWWHLSATASGIQVSPPAAYASELTVTPVAVTPAAIRLSINLPAVVSVTVREGSAGPFVVPGRLVQAGTVDLPLPPGPLRGQYQLTIQADAGGGRTAVVPVSTWVGAPPATPRPAPVARATAVKRRASAVPRISALALLLVNLGLVVFLTGATARRSVLRLGRRAATAY